MRIALAWVAVLTCALASGEELGRRKLDESFRYDGSGKVKVAFFDADSTLRVAPSGGVSAGGKRDAWILPLVTTELARLQREGYVIVIVSNQGGVPKRVSMEDADGALDFTRQMIRWLNPEAIVHYYDFATGYDHDRKPETGMMERFEKTLKEDIDKRYHANVEIDREHSFMCGDAAYKEGQTRPDGKPGTDISDSDRKVAENFRLRFIDPADLFHWRKYGYDRFEKKEQVDEFYAKNPQLKLPAPGPCPFPSLVKKMKTTS